MKKNNLRRAFFNPRALLGVGLCLTGVVLALFAFGSASRWENVAIARVDSQIGGPARFLPVAGRPETEPGDRLRLEEYWSLRLSYPTGRFDPSWVRRAAAQHWQMQRAIPGPHGTTVFVPGGAAPTMNLSGEPITLALTSKTDNRPIPLATTSSNVAPESFSSSLSLSSTAFTALGPQPENMAGCTGCYDYGLTEGRINTIAIDPTTTTNGSIVAYAGSDGGGVWKTTNCCSGSTSWTVTTDDPLISSIAISSIVIDPNNHNTIYAGTGDADGGGSPSGSSQGILKSTDGGATWTVLGSNVFPAEYPLPAGAVYPQYDAVGKVRVDPNNSNKVVAATKRGLFFSYDAGTNWTGPCTTNSFSTQRQETTALELSNMGGGVTRILAAVGVRGFGVTVRPDLANNGANGIYSAAMGSSGCPTFSSIASNANGFTFGTAVTGSPYSTGANMNAGSGTAYVSTSSGNQLSRIDLGVAPSNPNIIYAQAASIAANSATGCGSTAGCQLGAWVTANGGSTWTFMAGSAGGALRECASSGAGSSTAGTGDYGQNWYDQGVVVDPNNADRVFFDTFDVWLATRTGTSWYNLSCAYSQTSQAVHADQHALAFVPGSSSILVIGNDGGINATTSANSAADGSLRPTWFHMVTGLNTIEYYSGDIWSGTSSTGFATATTPWAAGAAQDNMDSFVHFAANPTGAVQWQGNIGGDGFYARIDGLGGYFYASNNNGAIHRCTTNCASSSASWSGDIRASAISGDQQSFVQPFDVFKGNPGGTGTAECSTRCNHMIVGTYRLWESLDEDGSGHGGIHWNASGDLTKGVANTSVAYINDIEYAPATSTLGIAGTFDGNVQIVYGLGSGGAFTAVNLTNSNTVLPNRPITSVAFDPLSDNTASHLITAYAAVAGFNDNTPSTPGHVFQVNCSTVNCTSFTWSNKSGNLPDISATSVMPNPLRQQQVFVGTDFGLYFTNDITVASPTWYRFESGMPHARISQLRVDRGNTTLSAWTGSRGAFVYPLPTGDLGTSPTPTPTATATATPASTPTATPTPTPTSTPTPTPTPTPTAAGGCSTDTTQADFQAGVGTNVDTTSSPGDVKLALATAALDQQQATTSTTGLTTTNTTWVAQGFVAGVSGLLNSVNVSAFYNSGTAGSLVIEIHDAVGSGSSATPGTTLLATSGNVPVSSGATTTYTFSFSSPPTLISGTTYFLMVHDASGTTATYGTTAACKLTPGCNPYTTGTAYNNTTSGSGAWTAQPTDLFFQTTVQPYQASGNLVSSLKDSNPASGTTPNWGTLSWTNAALPSGATLTFQAAASNSASGPFNFTTSVSNGGSLSAFNGLRYLKYKASFATSNTANTPTLNDVTVCVTNVALPSTSLAVASATGTYGGTVNLSATLTSSGNPVSGKSVSFSLNGNSVGSASTNASGVATLSNASLAGINAGSYPTGVGASFAGDSSYTSSSGTNSLTVNKANQTITFTLNASYAKSAGTVALNGTATSGLAVTYGSSNTSVATVSGSTMTLVAPGSVTITADQTGNGNYNAAPSVQQSTVITGPIAAADSVSRQANSTKTKIAVSTLLANDSRIASNGSTQTNNLSITSVTAGTGNSVQLSGAWIFYTPNSAAASAPLTFTYTLSDGSSTATGTVTVTTAGAPTPFTLTPVDKTSAAYDSTSNTTSITLEFITVANQSLSIEYSTDIAPWTPYANNPVSTGASGDFVITITATGDHAAEWNTNMYFHATRL